MAVAIRGGSERNMITNKFRIYPNKVQIHAFETTLDLSRELYNAMLQQRIWAHELGKRVNYNSQQNEIPDMKKAFPEFNNIHSQVLQEVARRLDKAYDNFFRRVEEKKKGSKIKAGYPRFKSEDRFNSFTYPQSGFRILENGHVWLSKIGKVRTFMHRQIEGEIRTLTIKRDKVGDWFITITTDLQGSPVMEEGMKHPHDFTSPIGTDLGLKTLITTSDGEYIAPPKFLRKSEKKLKKAQQELSRKVKGSGKRKKAKKKVAKIDRKIARQRDDHAHKTSTQLVSKHDLIVLEGLNIAGMMQNHNLAKSIADASWNTIVQYTVYKAKRAGSLVLLIDPRYTSQKCSRCGNIKHDLKLSDRIYHCNVCGLTIDRDLNAAINIRNDGLKSIGRGTPEFTPVEIGALPAMATPVPEAGSPRL